MPRLSNSLFAGCIFGSALALIACGSDDPDPCEGVEGTCVPITAGTSQTEVQEALINAESGSTIGFGAGRHEFTSELSLDVDGVTIRGTGMDSTILSFRNQADGAQGILVTSDDFTIEDIGLEDAPGDLLKMQGSNGVTIRRVRAEWTGGPSPDNGAYGLYPVQCSNVLMEDSVVIASSDAGFYVGQSDNIVIRRNLATGNVAGIEIENSTRADVYDNEATDNTGGILIFNLPGLEVPNGSGTRVYNNNIHENNHENFAPGGIVGKVPAGTGVAILAAHNVELFDNTIADHDSVNIGIISYTTVDIFDDPAYDPDPDTIWIHDNVITGTSDNPTGELGALLILGLSEVLTAPIVVPDIVWDGVVPAAKAVEGDPHRLQPALNICLRDNGDADFANLHWPDTTDPEADLDATNHDCELPSLPEVVLE